MEQQSERLSIIAGANLRRLIKELNITQEQAAEKLFLSEGSCIRRLIRNGIAKIDEIQRIAEIFEIPLSEMFKPIV